MIQKYVINVNKIKKSAEKLTSLHLEVGPEGLLEESFGEPPTL